MRVDHRTSPEGSQDTWLEAQCRIVEAAGRALADAVGAINERTAEARTGALGRKQRVTDSLLRAAEAAHEDLHSVQLAVQNALFDCEHELRALRERDMDPAELLVDGERLIRQYRFLRRRARVIDGLLAYLPSVTQLAHVCVEHLRRLRNGAAESALLRVPDCGFVGAAMEDLEEPIAQRSPRPGA